MPVGGQNLVLISKTSKGTFREKGWSPRKNMNNKTSFYQMKLHFWIFLKYHKTVDQGCRQRVEGVRPCHLPCTKLFILQFSLLSSKFALFETTQLCPWLVSHLNEIHLFCKLEIPKYTHVFTIQLKHSAIWNYLNIPMHYVFTIQLKHSAIWNYLNISMYSCIYNPVEAF